MHAPEEHRRNLLASAVESTSEMICISDVKDHVQFANASFLRMHGYSLDEILDRDARMFGSPNNPPDLVRRIVEVTFHESWSGELLNRKKDGTDFRIFLTISRVLGSDGQTVGFIRIIRDISAQHRALEDIRNLAASLERRVLERTAEVVTRKDELSHVNRQLGQLIDELREAKRKAEGASRAKSQFLAHVSHELRTPLNSVIGFANVMLRNKERTLSPQELSYLDKILANAKHLLSVINQLLDLSKIEAGRFELNLTLFPLEGMIIETIATMQSLVQSDEVDICTDIPTDIQPLKADEQKLRQVLINLIGNALKFTAKGKVSIRVIADDDRQPLRIDVVDTGIGIPEDKLDTIFEPFGKLKKGDTGEREGTGLGLAISRSLCKLMGFDLTATSEMGRGSTFSIHLRPHPAAD